MKATIEKPIVIDVSRDLLPDNIDGNGLLGCFGTMEAVDWDGKTQHENNVIRITKTPVLAIESHKYDIYYWETFKLNNWPEHEGPVCYSKLYKEIPEMKKSPRFKFWGADKIEMEKHVIYEQVRSMDKISIRIH